MSGLTLTKSERDQCLSAKHADLIFIHSLDAEFFVLARFENVHLISVESLHFLAGICIRYQSSCCSLRYGNKYIGFSTCTRHKRIFLPNHPCKTFYNTRFNDVIYVSASQSGWLSVIFGSHIYSHIKCSSR